MAAWLYPILNNPLVYRASQVVLAPGANFFLRKHFNKIFKDSKGLILDVGCGPQLNTSAGPEQKLVGLDINLGYIKSYSKDSQRKGVVGSAAAMPFRRNSFDECRSFGLLHHLADADARQTIQEIMRLTDGRGRVVIIDSVWPRRPYLRPLAWLLRKLDRGQWVRTEEALLEMVRSFSEYQIQSYRFTYTLIGHEALAIILRRNKMI